MKEDSMLRPPSLLDELSGHNVLQTAPGGGDILKVGDWNLHWKAQGKDTGYSFSIYEMVLGPNRGLPLHKHPYPEFFYVLEGNLSFCFWNESGESTWITSGAGGSVLAPLNAPHTFFNKGEGDVRFLSVSTHHHERMLKDAVTPEGNTHFLPESLDAEQFEALFRSMEKNQVYVVPERAARPIA